MNLRDKLLRTRRYLIASSIATALATVSLSGCGDDIKKFEYQVNSEGDIDATGVTEYDYLKNCYILVLNYNDDTKKYFVASVTTGGGYRSLISYKYYNIENDKVILTVKGDKIQNETISSYEAIPLCDYLTKDDYVKAEYSIDDIDKILENYKNEYGTDDSKKLIKKQ